MASLAYFAYGSNMSLARLQARIPQARRLGLAHLGGHVLRFHKQGDDGSAKLDAARTHNPDDFVLGVLYTLTEQDKQVLDRIEGAGYEVVDARVATAQGAFVDAFMYRAVRLDPSMRPFHWYVNHVLVGAREAGLPFHYVEAIAATETIADPDPVRDAREWAIHAPPGTTGQTPPE